MSLSLKEPYIHEVSDLRTSLRELPTQQREKLEYVLDVYEDVQALGGYEALGEMHDALVEAREELRKLRAEREEILSVVIDAVKEALG